MGPGFVDRTHVCMMRMMLKRMEVEKKTGSGLKHMSFSTYGGGGGKPREMMRPFPLSDMVTNAYVQVCIICNATSIVAGTATAVDYL
jgi:hypothetical protein